MGPELDTVGIELGTLGAELGTLGAELGTLGAELDMSGSAATGTAISQIASATRLDAIQNRRTVRDIGGRASIVGQRCAGVDFRQSRRLRCARQCQSWAKTFVSRILRLRGRRCRSAGSPARDQSSTRPHVALETRATRGAALP